MVKTGIFSVIILSILFLFAYDEMILFVKGLILIGLVAALWLAWYAITFLREKTLLAKAERKRAEVITIVAKKDEQIHIRESDTKAVWRAASWDPRVYSNGKWEDPEQQEVDAWLAWNQPKIIQGQATQVMQQMVPQIARLNLLEQLKKFERVLIIGVTDSGKTTLLMKLIENKQGKVIALDPHNELGKWPQSVKVVGGGRKFEAITQALADLVVLMNQRYDQMEQGLKKEKSFAQIWVVADEWKAAVSNSKEAAESLKELLNEGRKVNIGLILGSQSERVKALGIEGEGDTKESFAIARLKVNKLTGERRATLDVGEGEIECDFTLQEQAKLPVALPAQEQVILSNYLPGDSATKVMKRIYGQKGGGGPQLQKIKQVLNKHGYAV